MALAAQAERSWSGRVTHVSDGDTVWIQPTGGGHLRKIRIVGIDAPEICQAWGVQSRILLASWVLHEAVAVRSRRNDNYGRLLATREWRGEDIGARMVASGAAWSYQFRRDPGPYLAQELQARQAQRGLFADPIAERPRDFRLRHGACEKAPLPAGPWRAR